MIDDLTYFTFMQSYRPQHQLGVIGLWKGSISSGLGYLRSIRSDGFVVGCHLLPADIRVKSMQVGQFCCMGAGDLSP
jgi:hypothetical protein